MLNQIVGTKNDFLYQTLILSIRQEELLAKEKGERIYLIVMSTWMYEVISEHVNTLFTANIFDKYCESSKTRPILGYQVSLVEDLSYNQPVKFITAK